VAFLIFRVTKGWLRPEGVRLAPPLTGYPLSEITFTYELRHLGWALAGIAHDDDEVRMTASCLTHALDDLLYALIGTIRGHRYVRFSWDNVRVRTSYRSWPRRRRGPSRAHL
jgi:hypothetical protein